jgi:hypothetical protein
MKLFTVSYVGNISKFAKFESPETHYKFSSVISRRINRQKTAIPPTASLQPPPTGAIVVPIGTVSANSGSRIAQGVLQHSELFGN